MLHTMTRRSLTLALLLGALGAPAAAGAQAPTAQQVRELLSGYEYVPSGEDLRALGPDTLRVLIELYAAPDAPPWVRLRAIAAVGHYPEPATRTFLLAVARAEGQSDLLVREAVLALGRAFGEHAIADVRPFLSHREPVVREAAGMALGRIATPRAVDLLRARIVAERDPGVRRALDRSLTHALRAR